MPVSFADARSIWRFRGGTNDAGPEVEGPEVKVGGVWLLASAAGEAVAVELVREASAIAAIASVVEGTLAEFSL